MRRFVLLDRDGTINVDRGYVGDPDGLELVPGSAQGLRALSDAGFALAVVTNQSGVGRGLFDMTAVARVNARLSELLAAEGVVLDGFYVCPHAPEDGCSCRKPCTELAERAIAELGLDPTGGFVVGDKAADVNLGKAIGATAILVRTGYGAGVEARGEAEPDAVADDLGAAARIILASARESAGCR